MNPGDDSVTRTSRRGCLRRLAVAFGVLAGLIFGGASPAWSDPLDVWHVRKDLPAGLRGLAYDGNVFVAGSSGGGIFTSPDGVNWTQHSLPTNVVARSIAAGNGRFVMATVFGGLWVSSDGLSWTWNDPLPWTDFWEVTFGDGLFVAVGRADRPPFVAILTSADGSNWTRQTVEMDGIPRGVTYGNGTFVAVGHGPNEQMPWMSLTSTNGVDWTVHASTNAYIIKVAFGNGVFVGVGGTPARSTNGFDWVRGPPLPVAGGLQDVRYVEGTFIAVGDAGTIITSTDGENWVVRRSGDIYLSYLTAGGGGGRLLVVGSGILQSDPVRPVPPLITRQPEDRVLRVGRTYTNSVVAELEPVTYQWRLNGTNLPGATDRLLVVPNAPLFLSGKHSVVVSNNAGSVTSSFVNVLVAEPVGITVQPVDQTVVQGGTAILSVTSVGTLPLAFRWRRNGWTTNYVVLNESTCFLTVTNVQPGAAYDYTVVVSNIVSFPGTISATASLTVLADYDGDGMPDAFEAANGFATNNAADAALDFDGDGVSNSAEYLAGTDPRDARSYLRVERISAAGGAEIRFNAIATKTYTVQFADDLSTGAWFKLADVPGQETDRAVTLTDPAPGASRFYRLVTPRQP